MYWRAVQKSTGGRSVSLCRERNMWRARTSAPPCSGPPSLSRKRYCGSAPADPSARAAYVLYFGYVPPPIVVYTTEHCSYCQRAKTLLSRRGLAFTEIVLGKDPAGVRELVGRTGRMSFPQIMIGNEIIGGFDELQAADLSGHLADVAAAALL